MVSLQAGNELDQLLNYSERVGTRAPESSVVKRAKDILFHSASVWPIIAIEEGGLKEALFPYTLIVGFIPMVGASLLVSSTLGFMYSALSDGLPTQSLAGSLFSSLGHFVYELLGLLVISKIAAAVAPSFGLRKSWVLSTRVLVYAFTPSYIVAAVAWVPVVGWLAMLFAFLKSLRLAYEGFRIVLKAEKLEPSPILVESLGAVGTDQTCELAKV